MFKAWGMAASHKARAPLGRPIRNKRFQENPVSATRKTSKPLGVPQTNPFPTSGGHPGIEEIRMVTDETGVHVSPRHFFVWAQDKLNIYGKLQEILQLPRTVVFTNLGGERLRKGVKCGEEEKSLSLLFILAFICSSPHVGHTHI